MDEDQLGEAVDLGIPGLSDAVVIGRGASGVVYRASQGEFNRVVAVKVLPGAARESEGFERFERELKAMGPLTGHPNIVSVFGAGTTRNGRPYIVMEHVPGGSLSERIPVPVTTALDVGVRLAGALEAAHRLGILHRDVKPANVLVSAFGDVKLADFGISHIPGGHETQAGTLFVSLNYAAPELLSGAPPSRLTDIYALAATVYTLIAGHAPFEVPGEPYVVGTILARIATAPVPDLRPRGVPDAVCATLESGLARDPARRPQSMAAFAALLTAATASADGRGVAPSAAGATTSALPLPSPLDAPPAQAGRPSPRARIAAAAVVAAALAGVVVAVAARGGGGSATSTTARAGQTTSASTATVSATMSTSSRAVNLAAGVLTTSDLPNGFVQVGTSPLGVNSLVVCGNPFSPVNLQSQVGAQFAVSTGPTIESSVASFAPGTAAAFFTQFSEQTARCPSFPYVVGGVQTVVSITERPGPTLGDATLRLHIDYGNGVISDSVMIRLGDLIGIAELDTSGGDETTADTLAEAALRRMQVTRA